MNCDICLLINKQGDIIWEMLILKMLLLNMHSEI
jgi:hypothetical protein